MAYSRSSVDGAWYHFDDSSVRACSEEDVASDKAQHQIRHKFSSSFRPLNYARGSGIDPNSM